MPRPTDREYTSPFTNSRGRTSPTEPKNRNSYQAERPFSESIQQHGLFPALWNQLKTNLQTTFPWAGERIPVEEGVSNVVEGVGNAVGRVGEGMQASWEMLFGPGGGDPKFEQAQNNLMREQRMRAEAIGNVEKVLGDTVLPGLDLTASLENAPLDAATQYKVDQFRQGMEAQAIDLDRQLEQMQMNMQMQNMLYDQYENIAFGGNVVPGGDRQAEIMEGQLDQGGEKTGITPQLMEAINMIMTDPNLSGDDKMERVDFIMDQTSTQQQIRMGINDVTQNLSDLERIKGLPDVQMLMEMGETPSFVTPAFSYLQNPEIVADPTLRPQYNMASYMDSYFNELGVVVPPEQEEAFGAWLTSLGPETDFSNEVVQGQVANFASLLGVDASSLRAAVRGSMENAAMTEEAWATALTKQRLEPGSEEMAVAIFQVASQMGLPPEVASAIAESTGIHAIIKAKSDGKAGSHSGGSQLGVGGLSQSAYEKMGIDVENLGSMDVELGSLIRYIVENFQGDPDAALAYYYSTGDWGN